MVVCSEMKAKETLKFRVEACREVEWIYSWVDLKIWCDRRYQHPFLPLDPKNASTKFKDSLSTVFSKRLQTYQSAREAISCEQNNSSVKEPESFIWYKIVFL